MKELLTTDSALKRVLLRIFWMSVSALLTSAIVVVSDDANDAMWYPLVLFGLTTLKDIANRNLPNVPSEK